MFSKCLAKLLLSPKTGCICDHSGMTRDEAIAKLKESKDLFDLGLIKQDDYDKLKTELTPIIMTK